MLLQWPLQNTRSTNSTNIVEGAVSTFGAPYNCSGRDQMSNMFQCCSKIELRCKWCDCDVIAYLQIWVTVLQDHLPDQFLWESSMGSHEQSRPANQFKSYSSSALGLWRLSCSFRIWYPTKIVWRGHLYYIVGIKSFPFQITWLPGLDCESQPTSFQSENKNLPLFCLHGPVSTLTRCCKVQKCGWVQD